MRYGILERGNCEDKVMDIYERVKNRVKIETVYDLAVTCYDHLYI